MRALEALGMGGDYTAIAEQVVNELASGGGGRHPGATRSIVGSVMGILGPRVVSPHPQGLQGSHLNLSHRPAHSAIERFLNKAVSIPFSTV